MRISPTLASNALGAFGTSAPLPVASYNFSATQWQPSVLHMGDGVLDLPKSKTLR